MKLKDYIEEIPEYLLEIPSKYGLEIDIMIEAKMKEQAIFRLLLKYPKIMSWIYQNVPLKLNCGQFQISE